MFLSGAKFYVILIFTLQTHELFVYSGVSISTSADWLVNFLVSKCVPIMILPHSKVGGLGGTFLFFSGCTLLMTLWAITHVHETAGLTLEDIEDVFHASSLKQYRRYMAVNASYFLYFGGTNMRDYTRSLQCLPHEIPQSDTETETETVSDTNINTEADKTLKLESDISSDRNRSFPLI